MFIVSFFRETLKDLIKGFVFSYAVVACHFKRGLINSIRRFFKEDLLF